MAITNALILANAAIISVTIDELTFSYNYGYHIHFYKGIGEILGTLPILWLSCYITFKGFKTKIRAMVKIAKEKLSCCNSLLDCCDENRNNEVECVQQVGNVDNNLPDRMLRPQRYMQLGYESIAQQTLPFISVLIAVE